MAEILNHENMETELGRAKSMLYSGRNTRNTLGMAEKVSDTSDMLKLGAVYSDIGTTDTNTHTLLNKQVASKTEMPPGMSDDILDMEEGKPAIKRERNIADDLCIDLAARGLVPETEDNSKSQAASQSKTYHTQVSASFSTVGNPQNTKNVLNEIQLPGISESDKMALSESVSEQTATTVSLKKGNKKALVPRRNESHHKSPIKRAPVKGSNDLGISKEFSLKEYLEHIFALSGKKFEPFMNVRKDFSGCIKLSDLQRATKPLGISWEKQDGLIKPVEESFIGGNSFLSGMHWFGKHDIDGVDHGSGFRGTDPGLNIPSVVTEISGSQGTGNPLPDCQVNPEYLPLQGPVNILSQTAEGFPPQVQAAGNSLSETSQAVENFHPQAAEQLLLQTRQNLPTENMGNLSNQDLKLPLYQRKTNLQPQFVRNALTQTALFKHEDETLYTRSGSSIPVCSEPSVPIDKFVSNINNGTNTSLRPDPPDKSFFTDHQKIKHGLHNKVCPSKIKGQQDLSMTKTCSCPRYHPYQKTKEESSAFFPYQTSLPQTLTDL